MRNSFFALMIMITLAACSNYVYDLQGKFDESLKNYNNLYRWGELDTANMFFSESIRDDAIARIKAAKNVKIVDSRILSTLYDEKKRKAIVEVEIEYYFISAAKVKTLRDTQEWAYREEQGIKGWRLMSSFPAFK
jgi:hypothetical protein